jgi:hypothetical protein
MSEVAASQTAIDEVATSQTAMSEVATSQTAMSEVAASQTAMSEVATSQTAQDETMTSETARTEVFKSPNVLGTFWSNKSPSETVWNKGGTISLGTNAKQNFVSGRLGDSSAIEFTDGGTDEVRADYITTVDLTGVNTLQTFTNTGGQSLGTPSKRFFLVEIDGSEIARFTNGSTSFTKRTLDVSGFSGVSDVTLGTVVGFDRKLRYASLELL